VRKETKYWLFLRNRKGEGDGKEKKLCIAGVEFDNLAANGIVGSTHTQEKAGQFERKVSIVEFL